MPGSAAKPAVYEIVVNGGRSTAAAASTGGNEDIIQEVMQHDMFRGVKEDTVTQLVSPMQVPNSVPVIGHLQAAPPPPIYLPVAATSRNTSSAFQPPVKVDYTDGHHHQGHPSSSGGALKMISNNENPAAGASASSSSNSGIFWGSGALGTTYELVSGSSYVTDSLGNSNPSSLLGASSTVSGLRPCDSIGSGGGSRKVAAAAESRVGNR